jgi:hypothetical protein
MDWNEFKMPHPPPPPPMRIIREDFDWVYWIMKKFSRRIKMNDSEKLKIVRSALEQIDWLEENSPGTISFKNMFYEAQTIARNALADLNKKEID